MPTYSVINKVSEKQTFIKTMKEYWNARTEPRLG